MSKILEEKVLTTSAGSKVVNYYYNDQEALMALEELHMHVTYLSFMPPLERTRVEDRSRAEQLVSVEPVKEEIWFLNSPHNLCREMWQDLLPELGEVLYPSDKARIGWKRTLNKFFALYSGLYKSERFPNIPYVYRGRKRRVKGAPERDSRFETRVFSSDKCRAIRPYMRLDEIGLLSDRSDSELELVLVQPRQPDIPPYNFRNIPLIGDESSSPFPTVRVIDGLMSRMGELQDSVTISEPRSIKTKNYRDGVYFWNVEQAYNQLVDFCVESSKRFVGIEDQEPGARVWTTILPLFWAMIGANNVRIALRENLAADYEHRLKIAG